MKNPSALLFTVVIAFVAISTAVSNAQPITNFTSWTLTADPVNASFNGSNTTSTATLTAGNATVPAGTDIGYSSINGTTVLNSTSGNFFSAASSISLAIDYDLTVVFPSLPALSGIFIGFGIGEDSTGIDSAGVTLGAVNFFPFSGLLATARVNDVNEPIGSIGGTASLVGTFFVSYSASSGDVTVGAANTQNAASPTASYTFQGIANSWDNEDLLASFFLRSDNPAPIPAWAGVSASAVFSNFRTLEGTPVTIPEPSTAALLLAGCLGAILRRRSARAPIR